MKEGESFSHHFLSTFQSQHPHMITIKSKAYAHLDSMSVGFLHTVEKA